MTPITRKSKGAPGFRAAGCQIQRIALSAPPLHVGLTLSCCTKTFCEQHKQTPSGIIVKGKKAFPPALAEKPWGEHSLVQLQAMPIAEAISEPEKWVRSGQKHILTWVRVEACHDRMIVALADCHGADAMVETRRGWIAS